MGHAHVELPSEHRTTEYRAIERGIFSADHGLIVLLTVTVTLLCLAMIGYLLLTAANT